MNERTLSVGEVEKTSPSIHPLEFDPDATTPQSAPLRATSPVAAMTLTETAKLLEERVAQVEKTTSIDPVGDAVTGLLKEGARPSQLVDVLEHRDDGASKIASQIRMHTSIEELRHQSTSPLPAILERFQSAQEVVLGDRTVQTQVRLPDNLIALPGFVVHKTPEPEADTKVLQAGFSVSAAQAQAVEQQLKALDADQYQITVVSKNSGKPLYVGLDAQGDYVLTAKSQHMDADQVQAALPKLNALNRDGYNVQMTPKDASKDYVVVDSMTPNRLDELKEAGFTPAVVQQVGASMTVVMKVDKLVGDVDVALNQLVEEVRGDKGAGPPEAGLNDVRLVEASGVVDAKSQTRLEELGARGARLDQEAPAPAVLDAYRKVRDELPGEDAFAKDQAAVRELVGRGMSRDELVRVVVQESPVPADVNTPKEAYAAVLVDNSISEEKHKLPVSEMLVQYRRSERQLQDEVGTSEREVDVAVGRRLSALGASREEISELQKLGSPTASLSRERTEPEDDLPPRLQYRMASQVNSGHTEHDMDER